MASATINSRARAQGVTPMPKGHRADPFPAVHPTSVRPFDAFLVMITSTIGATHRPAGARPCLAGASGSLRTPVRAVSARAGKSSERANREQASIKSILRRHRSIFETSRPLCPCQVARTRCSSRCDDFQSSMPASAWYLLRHWCEAMADASIRTQSRVSFSATAARAPIFALTSPSRPWSSRAWPSTSGNTAHPSAPAATTTTRPPRWPRAFGTAHACPCASATCGGRGRGMGMWDVWVDVLGNNAHGLRAVLYAMSAGVPLHALLDPRE